VVQNLLRSPFEIISKLLEHFRGDWSGPAVTADDVPGIAIGLHQASDGIGVADPDLLRIESYAREVMPDSSECYTPADQA
jgi:hypothetical protein